MGVAVVFSAQAAAFYRVGHIGGSHGGLAVGNQQHRLVPALGPHRLEDHALVQAVEVGGRLVQQQEGCIVQECPRHTDALPLAAGQGPAQLTHGGVIPLGQAADKAVQRSLFAGRFHFFAGGIPLGDADVVLDGVVEQLRLLTFEAIAKPEWERVDHMTPLKKALEHEKLVTASIDAIYAAAYEAKDFRTMQMLDWFIKEQGEEEKNAADLITKMDLFGGDSKGLYMLNSELKARVYTAPSLVL